MSSILTNNSAMTALATLNATQKSLNSVQGQISTGLRIQDASDNAAYWSISTSMKSDTGALSAVSDALNLGSSVVAAASAAVTSTLSIMNKLKQDVVTAQQSGTSLSQVQSDITAQQNSLMNIISSASFNGVNLLDGSSSNGTAQVAASFTRSTNANGSQSTNVGFITINTSTTNATTGASYDSNNNYVGGSQLTGSGGILATAIAGLTATSMNQGVSSTTAATTGQVSGTAAQGNSAVYAAGSILSFDITKLSPTGTEANGTTTQTNQTQLTDIQAGIDLAISAITAVGAQLGAAKTNIANQQTFVSALSDSITSGVGSLEDADMNQASTRLNALQTQQQLGVQSLSIANQNSQMILKLFQ